MVELRKWFPALAILALLLGTSVMASAQTSPGFTCQTAAGVPPVVRAEGVTELLGDIVLNCTGGTPTVAGLPVPGVNINVFLNTAVTSKIISGNLTEALLLIDEPQPGSQFVCAPPTGLASCPATGTGVAGVPATGSTPAIAGGVNYRSGAAANIYQGTISTDGRFLSWAGVPIDPPGTVGTRVIRITNIRGNANQFGSAQIPIGTTLQGLGIQAFITITSTQSIALPSPQVTIGLPYRGLAPVTVTSSAPAFLQCSGVIPGSTAPFRVRFTEGFPSSFKRRGLLPGDAIASTATGAVLGLPSGYSADTSPAPVLQNGPGQNTFTETGFYLGSGVGNLGTGNAAAGLATNGTRLIVRLTNIPAGATIYAGLYENGATAATSRVRLVSADATGTGAFTAAAAGTPPTGSTATNVAAGVTSTSGAFVYEVMTSDPQVIETIDIPIYVSFAAGGSALTPTDTTPQISGALAPLASDASRPAASATLPIPRFADTATPSTAFTVLPCRTNLLFPYVTTQGGFETGIAISNTSKDPYNTANSQTGTCTINYYGTGTGGATVPAETTTASVASGSTLLFTVGRGSDTTATPNYGLKGATGVPNFYGYVIAVCNFQYAHGFAFITDSQLRVAEGYLALVLDAPTGSRTTFFSESLNN